MSSTRVDIHTGCLISAKIEVAIKKEYLRLFRKNMHFQEDNVVRNVDNIFQAF